MAARHTRPLWAVILAVLPGSVRAVERSTVETVRATSACLTETVRVTGFTVARSERRVGLPLPGYRVSEVLVTEGDAVQANQELLRATPLSGSGDPAASAAPVSLRSPIAGLVTQVSAAVGETTGNPAAADRPQVAISAGSGADLVVDVPSVYAARIRKGASARIRGLDGAEANGTVKLPVSVVQPGTQLGQARMAIEDGAHLRLGQFASARIEIARECRVTIPQAAVSLKGGVSSVQVLNGSTLETRPIRTGLSDDANVQVREGLSEGDAVVASAGSGVEPTDPGRPIGP